MVAPALNSIFIFTHVGSQSARQFTCSRTLESVIHQINLNLLYELHCLCHCSTCVYMPDLRKKKKSHFNLPELEQTFKNRTKIKMFFNSTWNYFWNIPQLNNTADPCFTTIDERLIRARINVSVYMSTCVKLQIWR